MSMNLSVALATCNLEEIVNLLHIGERLHTDLGLMAKLLCSSSSINALRANVVNGSAHGCQSSYYFYCKSHMQEVL